MRRRTSWLLALGVTSVLAWQAPALRAGQQAEDQDKDEAKKKEGLALKTAETIEFTTDEVTWMSIDVSPDGKTILFDLLGDLYTMPAAGGEATRIVGGLSFESQPTWSPDGRTIAFLSDRSGVENLWIADADGKNPRAVSKDQKTNDRPQIMASPAWTPDGQFIVVSRPLPKPFWWGAEPKPASGTGTR
jgi:dipeptidyl aminopeptidase/acylaminoacyl peptidase